MFDFLTPQLFDALVWAVIIVGGALALLRLYRDLTGPPRWTDDAHRSGGDSSGPPGPTDDHPTMNEET